LEFLEPVEDILLIFLIVEKGPEAGRRLFDGEGFFLDELSGSQWIVEVLDVQVCRVDFTQEPGAACGSHYFNVKLSLIISKS
jgi:hypothetical protein